MQIKVLLILVLVMLSVRAQAADREKPREQYLCIAEQAAGFSYDKNGNRWKGTTFTTDSKYVISRATKPNAAFQIAEVGNTDPHGWCKEGFNDAGFLSCGMIWGDFTYNKNNGRFIRSSPFGYIDVGEGLLTDPQKKITDDKTDTPYMEIGKCSPF